MSAKIDIPSSVTNLSDDQLRAELLSLGHNAGPVLPSTRRVYERKLFSLQTGLKVEPCSDLSPVDSDDEDDDSALGSLANWLTRSSQFVTQKTSQAIHRGRADDEPLSPPLSPPRHSPPKQKSPQKQRPEERYEESRDGGIDRMIRKPSPRKPLHPDKGDYYPRYRTPVGGPKRNGAQAKNSRGPAAAMKGKEGGAVMPSWVPALLVVLMVVTAVFIYFVVRNMEPEPVSNIPEEIDMV